MKNIKWIIGILVILGLGFLIISQNALQENEQSIIKIGVIAPLTGDLANVGEGVVNALRLAESESYKDSSQYKLIIEDDQFNPKQSVTAANKLISVDEVDFLISLGSATGNAISPIAEKNKIIHFAQASDPTVAEGEFNFVHWTPPVAQAELLVSELVKRDYKNIAFLGLNHSGTNAIFDAVRSEIDKTENIEVSNTFLYNSGESDFKTLLSKADSTDPDIYLIMAFTPELEVIVRQMQELNIQTPKTSIEAFGLTREFELFEGDWYVDAAVPSDSFIAQYESHTEGKGYPLGAPNTYDIYKLIQFISEDTEGSFIDSLKNNIDTFPSVFGKLEMLENGIIKSEAAVVEIKEGKILPIKK